MSGEGLNDFEQTETADQVGEFGRDTEKKAKPEISQEMLDRYGSKEIAKYFNPDGTIRDDIGVSKFSAAIARDQYLDYMDRFRPIEEQVAADITDAQGQQEEVDAAVNLAGSQFDTSLGSTRRRLGRYGIDMTPEQRKHFRKKADLNKSLAEITAANTTRRGIEDRNLGTSENMITLGRNLASDSSGMVGNAAGLGQQRRAQNRAASAANSGSTMGAIGNVVGIGAGIASIASI